MADTCRVCLCSDRRMHDISNTVFQHVWEKLTDATFNTNYGKPLFVCYMCYAHLRKSHQLMKRAQKAEELLTSVVNNGSEQSQKAILLVASLTHDFDYKYAIGEVYQLECNQFDKNTVDEIKKEKIEQSEEENEEKNDINIKEEEGDSGEEENVDITDVEPGISLEDDMPLKKIPKREVQIISENIEMRVPKRKLKLNEVPQKAKRIKLDETVEDRKLDAALKSGPNNNFKTLDISVSKKDSMVSNVKIAKRKQTVKSADNCNQIIKNEISPKVNVAKDDIVQRNKILGSKVCDNTAENEIFVEFLPSTADAVAPSTSLDTCDEKIKSNICLGEGLINDFSCHLCQFKCFTKSMLSMHLGKHTGKPPYICDLCDYGCTKKTRLTIHRKRKHPKENKFSCHMCPYKCVKKGELNNHLRKHTGEKPYICDLCDYRCSKKTSLTSHIKHKHTKEKNFSCHICQYKCIRKNKLKQHIRTHTGEKPYICDLCGHRFTQTANLNMHIKNKHTKEKNFSCHICQYKCVTNFKLNLHLRKHTGERPYKCDLCDHRCAQKSNLVIHIKNKHAKENNVTHLANVSQKAP